MERASDVRIRCAQEPDLPALIRLLGVLFALEADFAPDPARQRAGLALMLDDPLRRAVLVAERDGVVVGMVTAQLVVSTAEGAPSALVEDLVVAAAERGRGVGRALAAAIEAWAVGRGATRLQLLADRENGPALAFYARLGWRTTQLVCLRRGGR
ncbi:MAG TPA: GNAT family N-acetyltransferase [Anaeromyxobacter sp.]